jgi:uncharacterized membrane protein YoaT (DUF817 family)
LTVSLFINELWHFGLKQIKNCAFAAFIFGMLAFSKIIPATIIPRYDFMLLMCIGAQALLYFTGYETKRDLVIICTFHLIGLVMEIYKVNIGSWSYPEFAYTKIAGVPLYSGFMYAAVASYMLAAWRRFDLRFNDWPKAWICLLLAALIYLNFFTNHFIQDFRYLLLLLIIPVFYKSNVYFKNIQYHRKMPVLVSFVLIAFFIFIAENIATFFGAWKYAHQHNGWQLVKWQKMSSWTFMVMISYFIIAVWKKASMDSTAEE